MEGQRIGDPVTMMAEGLGTSSSTHCLRTGFIVKQSMKRTIQMSLQLKIYRSAGQPGCL